MFLHVSFVWFDLFAHVHVPALEHAPATVPVLVPLPGPGWIVCCVLLCVCLFRFVVFVLVCWCVRCDCVVMLCLFVMRCVVCVCV